MSVIAAHNWMWSARPAGRAAHGIARLRRKVRAELALEPKERILLETRLRDGGFVVSTDRAVIIVAATASVRRLRWSEIISARWSRDNATTLLQFWPDGQKRPARLELFADQKFALLAADRVAAAQVLCRRVQLTEAVAATVLATRTPGRDEVAWRVLLDAAYRDDPAVAAAARRAIAELRALAGC